MLINWTEGKERNIDGWIDRFHEYSFLKLRIKLVPIPGQIISIKTGKEFQNRNQDIALVMYKTYKGCMTRDITVHSGYGLSQNRSNQLSYLSWHYKEQHGKLIYLRHSALKYRSSLASANW